MAAEISTQLQPAGTERHTRRFHYRGQPCGTVVSTVGQAGVSPAEAGKPPGETPGGPTGKMPVLLEPASFLSILTTHVGSPFVDLDCAYRSDIASRGTSTCGAKSSRRN